MKYLGGTRCCLEWHVPLVLDVFDSLFPHWYPAYGIPHWYPAYGI